MENKRLIKLLLLLIAIFFIPNNTASAANQCVEDRDNPFILFRDMTLEKNPIGLHSNCVNGVWLQRNLSKALSCSSNFMFNGYSSSQWENWSNNEIENLLNACGECSVFGNTNECIRRADLIIKAMEKIWGACIPNRKGISCRCENIDREEDEETVCDQFQKFFGPPSIDSISPSSGMAGQTIRVYGKYLGNKIELVEQNGDIHTIDVDQADLPLITSFVIPDLPDKTYFVYSSGISGTSTENIPLKVTIGGPPFTPKPTISSPSGFPEFDNFMQAILDWSIRLLGIAIFVMFFKSGVEWFFAKGDPGKIAIVKDALSNAIIGAIILLSAYLILYTINPDLVKGSLNLPGITTGVSK